MTPGAGRLVIRLSPGGAAPRAAIAAPAPLPFDRLLQGRDAEGAARLVPLLFNVCAAAQGACARAALSLAQEGDAAEKVRAETLRGHALKLCMELPALLGQKPEPMGPAAMAAPDSARAVLFGGESSHGLPGDCPADCPADWPAMQAWALEGATAPARALAALLDWPAEWGRAAPLPAFDPAAPLDGAAPGQGGQAVENSVLGRMSRAPDTAPATAAALAERGAGPAARVVALLEEAASLLSADPAPDPLSACGDWAAAAAGRGAMLMQAALDADGRVAAARRLSPTDFALAPGGALETALETLPEGPAADTVARVAIALVDPCIPWALETGAAGPERAHA